MTNEFQPRKCDICGKEIKEETELGGMHFAGSYCTECWEVYKKKNSKICRICGKPEYACHC